MGVLLMARTRVPVPETGRIWTPEMIGARWGCLPAMVEKMCREGRITGAFKAGRQWRLTEEALVAHERGGGFGSRPYTPGDDS